MSELHQRDKTPRKRNFFRALTLALLVYLVVFITLFVLVRLPEQLNELRNTFYSQISGMQYGVADTLSEADMETLLKQYLDEEKSVVASAEVSIQNMDIKGNKARIALTCVPRYAVEDASSLRFYAINTAGEVSESDEEQYNRTTFQAKISLPMDDQYDYYVSIPDAAGAMVNQRIASWEAYDSEACNLAEKTQLDIYVYTDNLTISGSGKNVDGQIVLNFNEEIPEEMDARCQILVDGKVQNTISMSRDTGYQWEGPFSLSGEAFTQGQNVTFRVTAEDAEGRSAAVYADTGLRYDENGWDIIMVNSETGKAE